MAALSTITISIFYLTAQMVGGGVLVKTLIGIDYEVSVIAVGVLMLAYVVFGGMVATTWVQIIKAVLLVSGVGPAGRSSRGRHTASACPVSWTRWSTIRKCSSRSRSSSATPAAA